MTIQVNGKPATSTPDPADRTREQIINAHRDRDEAIRSEYEGLLDIAYSHHLAVSSAIRAASRAHGVEDGTRLELIHQALDSTDGVRL